MLDTVIVIPYRAREEHLKYYLENTVPLLQKHIPNGKVVIVEQDWNNKLFNRGCILNIGFNEYKDKTKYFMTHDVDINPYEQTIIDYYLINNFDALRIRVGHGCSVGGITKFSHDSIFNVNGFPNYIWGWGIEDRALYYRYKIMKKTISEPLIGVFNAKNYLKEFNHSNRIRGSNSNTISNNENNIFNNYNYDDQIKHIKSSGLNNLEYKILEKKDINDYVELIKVSI